MRATRLSSVDESVRDDLMGGLLATAVAAPLVIICCGGGAALLAGFAGALGGWLSGLNGIAVAVAITGAALAKRSLRRHNTSAACCVSPAIPKAERHD